jgi:hypothetical protein
MANLKRLTDRVKSIEKWIEENGDGDNMSNMHYLIRSVRQAGDMLQNEQQQFANFKNLVFEWMQDRKHGDDWNEFIKEKENAVQESETEEVPVQEQAEDSEEVIEEEE